VVKSPEYAGVVDGGDPDGILIPRLRHGLLPLYGRPPGRVLARHAGERHALSAGAHAPRAIGGGKPAPSTEPPLPHHSDQGR